MKTLTFEEFSALNPAWLGNKEQIKSYFDRFGGRMSALDILNLDDVSAKDKLWAVLREEFIPAPILHEFACVCAEYALSLVRYQDPRSIRAIEVKRAWLRDEATDEELYTAAGDAARAASAVADTAAWAAEVAWYATYGGAAYWAASNAALYAAEAVYSAAKEAARDAFREAQVVYLIMTLEEEKGKQSPTKNF